MEIPGEHFTHACAVEKECRMTRRLVTALGVLLTSSLAAPNIGHAQTFKVQKFDIKGDGGTTMSLSKPPRGACSFRVPVT